MSRTTELGRLGGILPLLLGLLACSGGPDREAAPVEARDSAGIRIVRLPPLDAVEAPRWDTRTLYRSTRGATEVHLFYPIDAVVLEDASVVVADSGNRELIRFAPDGSGLERIGRQGDGPGEFSHLVAIGAGPGGSFWTFDRALRRLTHFSPGGEVDFTVPLRWDSRVIDLRPVALRADGTLLSVYGDVRLFLWGGERRDTLPLLEIDPAGAIRDTLGLWPGRERSYAVVGRNRLLVPVGFGRDVAVDGSLGAVAIGSTDSLDLSLYGPEGRLRLLVRGGTPPRPVPDRDRERWLREHRDRLPVDRPGYREAWTSGPVRETYPGFAAVALGDDLRTWIRPSTPPGARTSDWLVVDSLGTPTGRVELPAEAEVLAVGHGRVVLRYRGAYDERWIEVLAVEPG